MFDKFKQGKQLLQMRQQATQLKKQMDQIEHKEVKGDNEIKVNGSGESTYVKIDGRERPDIKELINKAVKTAQKESAKKMMEMGGGLSGLLKGFGN